MTSNLLLKEVRTGTQGRNLEAKPELESMENELVISVKLFQEWYDTCNRLTLVLQLEIKKMSHRHVHNLMR